MSQISDKTKELKDTAERLLSGILSNPNYNFDNVKKAATIAVDHAQALLVKIAETVEAGAGKVAVVADKVGDKLRGKDDAPKAPVVPQTDARVDQNSKTGTPPEGQRDPLADI